MSQGNQDTGGLRPVSSRLFCFFRCAERPHGPNATHCYSFTAHSNLIRKASLAHLPSVETDAHRAHQLLQLMYEGRAGPGLSDSVLLHLPAPPEPLLQGLASEGRVSSSRTLSWALQGHLEEQLLGVDVVHQAHVVLVHHGQLVAGGTHVQAAHGGGLLQQDDGKEIVHKDLEDLAKFQRGKCE